MDPGHDPFPGGTDGEADERVHDRGAGTPPTRVDEMRVREPGLVL